MDRSLPKLTCYPCNPRTRQAFSLWLRVRTVVEALSDGELDSALLPQMATALQLSSPRASRTATTASRVTRHAALSARRSTGVVNT